MSVTKHSRGKRVHHGRSGRALYSTNTRVMVIDSIIEGMIMVVVSGALLGLAGGILMAVLTKQ